MPASSHTIMATSQADNQQSSSSPITQFYKNANILITGASGFLGKVILWKLVATCSDFDKIYVLMRSKNDISAHKRLIQMLKSKPFAPEFKYTDLLEKIVAIESDLTVEKLGLSQADRCLLEDKVNIVIHSAASIKFDAPLKDNLRDNVFATRSMLDLCNGIKNLKAFVHVSTAYSNCHMTEVEEELVPLKRNIDDVVQTINMLPSHTCDRITEDLLEGRPNTYTYTKAIAEQYVAREEGKFPICIVRPSIVIPATKEPRPGWVDNVNGIAGLGCLASVGLLRTIDWNYYSVADMVPVDYVANCIICAAPKVHNDSPKDILVFNMTSSDSNPIAWGEFFNMLREHTVDRPTNKVVRPIIHPPKHERANPVSFLLIRHFSELLFAYFVDMLLSLIGYKNVLVKITHKMHHGYKILMPFTTKEWKFHSTNLTKMSEELTPNDAKLFPFCMKDFDWQEHSRHTWDGARDLLLKEKPTQESYKSAKLRLTIIETIHNGFLLLALAVVLYFGAKLVYMII